MPAMAALCRALSILVLAVVLCPATGLAATREEIDRISQEYIEIIRTRRKAGPAPPSPELPPEQIREQIPGGLMPPIYKAPAIEVTERDVPIIIPPAPSQEPLEALPPLAPLPSALTGKPWTFSIDTGLGWVKYREREQTLESAFDTFFTEAVGTLARRGPSDTEITLRGGAGITLTDTETWDLNDAHAQTNDLSFHRFTFEGRFGKWFDAPDGSPLRTQPFVNYGARYLRFERSRFAVANALTIRDTVDESYWVHHLGGGVRVVARPSERWEVDSAASLGWVFRNTAKNSVLGTVDGGGGVVAGFSLGAACRLAPDWRMKIAGSVDVQDLEGGETGTVIWPDNTLQVLGGNVEFEYSF